MLGTLVATIVLTTVAVGGTLDDELRSLIEKLPDGTVAGLLVVDAETGRVFFENDADRPLKPASVMKLLTSSAAIEHLGRSFRYRTGVYLRDGELIVVGSGDPGLGDPRIARRRGRSLNAFFDDIAASLKAQDATSVDKIVFDDGVFDREYTHPDWPDSQADRWYQAPVGALNFNDNCLDVTVQVQGQKVVLELQPALPPTLIDHSLRVGNKTAPVGRQATGAHLFELSGTVKQGGELDPIAAPDPTLFFAHALKHALEQRGIDLHGQVVRRRATQNALADATRLLVHETTMDEVLWRCNTFSQNLFAECLFKSLGAYDNNGRRSGVRGSWDSGRRQLRTILTHMGLDLQGAVIRDGSGLSHSNRLTARQVCRILRIMRAHDAAPFFRRNLAQPGEPGSMGKRYDAPELRGRLYGKTGTLSGVKGLSGYIDRDDGRSLVFGLLVNGQSRTQWLRDVASAIATADVPDEASVETAAATPL